MHHFIFLLLFSSLASATSKPSLLVNAAIERTTHQVTYDGRYIRLKYPMGDVPNNIGVCSDVVIRSYRAIGIDLQKRLHEDMKRAFNKYPNHWGLKKTDSNIDHRRVPNLRVFFTRKNASIPISNNANNFIPGDLVSWKLNGRLPHIGIVINKKSTDKKRYLIVHNIGTGPQIEDVLFEYKMTGHYRYFGD
ncbi:MAG: DUF1287 domain-containing protein [Methylococcales bacterium]|jgi:uncharacterized protein|nr:DUF1287 domain-containing protein [Methylococcales bacterium]MBT7409144.1 DUF1287 domain-containing protein [Methylococcales bacterium]